jgi:hypothetical protein
MVPRLTGNLFDEKTIQSLIAYRYPEDLVINPRAALERRETYFPRDL